MEKTLKYSALLDVIQQAINKTYNRVCQKRIVTGEAEQWLQNELNQEGQLYLMNVLRVLDESGIKVENDLEEKEK